MGLTIARALAFGLILTVALPSRGTRAEAGTTRVSRSFDGESRFIRTERVAVRRAVLKLFEICKSERYAEAARRIVYRGPDKRREWVDLYDYRNLAERSEVDSICVEIKTLLERSDSYKFSGFSENSEAEGRWRVWEIIFRKGSKRGKVYFAFLKIRGRYALGDIDGHLAYIRLVK